MRGDWRQVTKKTRRPQVPFVIYSSLIGSFPPSNGRNLLFLQELLDTNSAHAAVAAFTFSRRACSSGSVYPLGWARPLKARSLAAG